MNQPRMKCSLGLIRLTVWSVDIIDEHLFDYKSGFQVIDPHEIAACSSVGSRKVGGSMAGPSGFYCSSNWLKVAGNTPKNY